jgi:DNA-binding MurR/RpiR family transcriptional regulator
MATTGGTTPGMRQVEERIGRSMTLYLQDAYNDRQLSMAQIGAELGVDKTTVSRWMRQLGIRGIRYVGYVGRKPAA